MDEDRAAISGKISLPVEATNVRPARQDENIEISVLLRRPPGAPESSMSPGAERFSQEDFALRYGAAESDVAAVNLFASAHGLKVLEIDRARRTMTLSGSVSALSQAFHVTLVNFEIAGRPYFSYSGEISVSRELDGIVVGIFGLDNLPAARTRHL